MSELTVYQQIMETKEHGKHLLAMLIDPDKFSEQNFREFVKSSDFSAVDLLFAGGSFLSTGTNSCIEGIKKYTDKPVILFPGNACHISKNADAILLLSLISGRNAEFLIGNHVTAAPFIKKSGIEAISTGYMLIGNGNDTSVEYISNTHPIPAAKTDIAVATALAGEMLGMKLIYLEAGSGARKSVPDEMVRAVSNACNSPLIVGGGINTQDQMERKFENGATIVVIGSAFEKGKSFKR
ncbi:MAG: geranylgeranylglyceryl/heptaprenylglyceryl phosphate synthase [Bacteroidales bacterium]|nr:geranylgeranylglyceryl/heptaprenylglyceryl phosphate synthase [Bacteroidales bacterium]HOY39609.1 geranylgeranylglyceryl/heptaprenylglyceryl phosphate synthase [Bacteroidales bacterium]HQP04921.1 geranylgeranylglyceryl/heptaprenylglyceryl phosphate synthase [Bacteroidales bacterium]